MLSLLTNPISIPPRLSRGVLASVDTKRRGDGVGGNLTNTNANSKRREDKVGGNFTNTNANTKRRGGEDGVGGREKI